MKVREFIDGCAAYVPIRIELTLYHLNNNERSVVYEGICSCMDPQFSYYDYDIEHFSVSNNTLVIYISDCTALKECVTSHHAVSTEKFVKEFADFLLN